MIVLGFVQDTTWLVMIVSGLIGIFYSGERVLNVVLKADFEDNFTKLIKKLSLFLGFFSAIWVSLLIIDEVADFRWLTIFLLIAFMLVSLAHPVKNLEGWKTVIITFPFLFISIVAIYANNDKLLNIFGKEISLTAILGLGTILIFTLFILVFFLEDKVVDPFLWILGWAPLKLLVCSFVFIQGIALILYPIEGILVFL